MRFYGNNTAKKMHCIYKERNLEFSNTNSVCGHMNEGGCRGGWEAGKEEKRKKK